MSFNDQLSFFQSICPFSELSEEELNKLIKHTVIGFYPQNSILIDPEGTFEVLFLVIKGEVRAIDGDGNITRVYHAHESFGADAIIDGKSHLRYEVSEDLICYELSSREFMRAFLEISSFKQFYLMDIVDRINYLKKKETSSDISEFMIAKVSDSYLHEPCIVPCDELVSVAIQKSIQMKSSSIVVQKDTEYGIVTDSDIKNSLSRQNLELSSAIGDMAHFPLISVSKDDFLFNAYLELIQKNIKKMAVLDGDKIIGMLEQIDVLSYFANHSSLAIVKIDRATTIEQLQDASRGHINIVKKLHTQGVKARYIAKLVSQINQKVFAKLFDMILPIDMRDSCTFAIMGSEGRSEQVLRTDQDNCLIVSDSVDIKPFREYMLKLSNILLDFGYPPCNGEVMVSNPYWCKSESEYRTEILHWLQAPDMDSYIYFSIFFDAKCVAGNDKFLLSLKNTIRDNIRKNNDVYMARFANLTLLFDTPVGFFSTFLHRDRKIDLKKAGIFPIVQGVRALALKYEIDALSTAERIKALVRADNLDNGMAKELIEAFEVLLFVRLEQQLTQLRESKTIDNHIDTSKMSKIQRDLLKDSLQIVDKFKKYISRDFRLDNL